MIQANELRIGNIHKINSISVPKLGINGSGYARISGYGIHLVEKGEMDFEPITLTEEILLKCGFKKHKAGAGGQDQWAGMDGWSYGNSSDWLFRGDACNLSLVGYFNTQIKYLHTLQNIYYDLRGEELEISL